jgi:hypothetical protein
MAWAAWAGLATDAAAHPLYVSDLPNGKAIDGRGCVNCHTSALGGGPRNAFGSDMLVHGFSWNSVCSDDSDGDGQSNGQELGDPLCAWTGGIAARTTAIANPGAANSTSSDPNGITPVDPNHHPDALWMCPSTWWGDGTCDCGCGSADFDCSDNLPSSCTFIDCDQWQPTRGLDVDAADPTQCAGGIAPFPRAAPPPVDAGPDAGPVAAPDDGGVHVPAPCPPHSTATHDAVACRCDEGFEPDLNPTGNCVPARVGPDAGDAPISDVDAGPGGALDSDGGVGGANDRSAASCATTSAASLAPGAALWLFLAVNAAESSRRRRSRRASQVHVRG